MLRSQRFAAALLMLCATVTSYLVLPPVLARGATALFMGGTGHPLTVPEETPAYIASYVQWAYNDFVGPSGLCTGGNPGCAQVAVFTPAQFWPITGLRAMQFDASVTAGVSNLDNCLRGVACTVTDPPFTSTGSRALTDTAYTVFGYSQSGTIASFEKNSLIAHPPAPGTVSFVFEANPNRPNGGILERFVGAYIPILGVTFNGATATNSPQPTPLTTVDVSHQYDPVGDFPTNPLNLIADLNSLLGFAYEHPEEGSGTPALQGQYQDSTYYLVPTVTGELPLVRPFKLIPFIGPLIATMLDPPLRVLVETGYDRTVNPGTPTPAKYLYFPNPITTAINVMAAIPTGWDNGIAYLTGNPANRPFGTTVPGPYGVGGPPVNAGAIDPYGPPTPYIRSTSASAPRVTTLRHKEFQPATNPASASVRAERTRAGAPAAAGMSHRRR
ncbi:MAG: PE-PPE domain-containing protein [Candidatus Nanopelagicales bacterium]